VERNLSLGNQQKEICSIAKTNKQTNKQKPKNQKQRNKKQQEGQIYLIYYSETGKTQFQKFSDF